MFAQKSTFFCKFSFMANKCYFQMWTFIAIGYWKIFCHLTQFGNVYLTDKRTDVWSRPSCIYTQIFSPKKPGFSPIKNTFQKILTFVYLYSMQLFSADPKIFSKKNLNCFFVHKNFKKLASKVAHNWPRPF